jgi:hypothetical protein
MSLPPMESTNPFTRRDAAARETRRRLTELASTPSVVDNSGLVLDNAAQTIQNAEDIAALNTTSVAQAAQIASLTTQVTELVAIVDGLITASDDHETRIAALEGP